MTSYGQAQVRGIMGPNLGLIAFYLEEQEGTTSTRNRTTATFDPGSGFGWHAGGSVRLGNDPIELEGSIIFIWQQVTAGYARRDSWTIIAGYSATDKVGQYEDTYTLVEAPLQLSISATPSIRFAIGPSPWYLIAQNHRDHGVQTDRSSFQGYQPTTSTSTYDVRDRSRKGYSILGVSATVGMAVLTKKRISFGLSTSISLTPIFPNKEPYAGHLSTVHFSVGYLFGQHSTTDR